MPGGSIGGRPFREDPNSYSRTGIPCGNPKRFHSQSVTRMAPDTMKIARRQPLDMPDEDIETEGEKQIKVLLEQQIDTKLGIKGHIEKYRSFTRGTKYKPLSGDVSGQRSLVEYEQISTDDQQIDTLRRAGLSDDEIQFKLQHDQLREQTPPKQRNYGVDPATIQERLQAIDRKIESKAKELDKPDTFVGVKTLSRHEMDLERAITNEREGSRQFNFLVKEKSVNAAKDRHFQDNFRSLLHEAHDQVTGYDKRHKESNSVEKNIKQKKSCILMTNDVETKSEYLLKPENSSKSHSDGEDSVCNIVGPVEGPICRKESDKLRALDGDVELIPEETIYKYKLTLNELKMIPRFKDYSPGEPSCTLFVKNLAPKISEIDLVSLFLRYEKPSGPKIVYKLLTGRMKGQAFVTFDSVQTARSALELVNGYPLKGKPIVAVFSKSKTNCS